LFRFDGTKVSYQRHKAGDSTSIPNNTVVSISEDKRRNIWIGTMGGIAVKNHQLKLYVDQNEYW
jgi:ligand-binding sensor domain-containing protein